MIFGLTVLLSFTPCTGACRLYFCKCGPCHRVMKADLRFIVKDCPRKRTLRISLETAGQTLSSLARSSASGARLGKRMRKVNARVASHQGRSEAGPGRSKPEIRRPKAEVRAYSHLNAAGIVLPAGGRTSEQPCAFSSLYGMGLRPGLVSCIHQPSGWRGDNEKPRRPARAK